MVSPTYTSAEVYQIYAQNKSKPARKLGLRIHNGKLEWQSVSGKWRPIQKGHMYWFRGIGGPKKIGRWSEVTPSIDAKRRAKKVPQSYWERHRNQGDYRNKI